MKKTKRIVLIVALSLLLLVILFFVCRCEYRFKNGEKHFDEMYALAYETIPGYEYHNDSTSRMPLRFFAQDEYGRYMYRVNLRPLPGGYNYALIIVQAEDKDAGLVYYYEGQSTVFVHHTVSYKSTDEDKAKIEELKKQNDWGKPLQKDKMSSIPVSKYPYPDTHAFSEDK